MLQKVGQMLGRGTGLAPALLPTPSATIFFEGDSITAGVGDNTASFPSQFAAMTGYSAINGGHSGDTIADMTSAYASDTGPSYSVGTCTTLVLLAGTNDIGGDGKTDTELQTLIQSYVSAAKTTGWTVIVGTLPPRGDDDWNETKEGYRVAFNVWMKAAWASFADGLLDFAALPVLADPANTNFVQDGLHPHNNAAWVMADLVRTRFGLSNVDDKTPDAFAFSGVTGASLATLYTSNTISLAGLTAPAPISVSGGEYSINGAAFTSVSRSVAPYDFVRVRQTSSADNATETDVTLTIGGVSGTYAVTTLAAAPETATWDPDNKSANISLSNGNLDATLDTTADSIVIATTPQSAGKWYFEIEITAGTNCGIGVADESAGLSTWMGSDAHTGGDNAPDGSVYWSNALQGSTGAGALATNDVVGVAVDIDAQRFYFSKNGDFGSADPAAGTGGFWMPSGTVKPACALYTAGVALRLRTTAEAFDTSPPSGFSAWSA